MFLTDEMIIKYAAILLCSAVVLDSIFGDPYWLPHPVRGIGKLITLCEKVLFPRQRSKPKEIIAGCLTVLFVAGVPIILYMSVAFLFGHLHEHFPILLSGLTLYAFIASRSLMTEANRVKRHLKKGDLQEAQLALSMIVGRDTNILDESSIINATIETIAENITDGIISPLFYFVVGGPAAVLFFKAVSTMDSMIGYNNDRYHYFGKCAARCDDVLNFIPARITAFILIPLVAVFIGKNGKNALRVVIRDRLNHKSPNSAHGEAAMAGALGIRLGGGAYYRGKYVERPYIGDAEHPVSWHMISGANSVTFGVTLLATFLCCVILNFV